MYSKILVLLFLCVCQTCYGVVDFDIGACNYTIVDQWKYTFDCNSNVTCNGVFNCQIVMCNEINEHVSDNCLFITNNSTIGPYGNDYEYLDNRPALEIALCFEQYPTYYVCNEFHLCEGLCVRQIHYYFNRLPKPIAIFVRPDYKPIKCFQ